MPTVKKAVRTIRQIVQLPGEPAVVYRALCDPKEHSAFTRAKAVGKARVGGKFTAHDGYISGTYLELKPGKKIVQSWETSEWPEGYGPSRLEFTFKASQYGTTLTMVQWNTPASQAPQYNQGWKDYYWKPLKKHLKDNG